MPAQKILPHSDQILDVEGQHYEFPPDDADHSRLPSSESPVVLGTKGSRRLEDHDSEESGPDWQPSPVRFSRKTCPRLSPSSDEEDTSLQDHAHHGRKVSFDDSDSDEGLSDQDDHEGLADDIQHRRRKLRNDEIDEVVEMFREFEETKVKPCAERLGCTVTRLMRVGKWALNTPERRLGGNPWNAYLKNLKGL
jgi:hypothetical protein